MTTTAKNMLVLKNGAGEYYVLPEELLEQCRIPAEQSAEAERLFVAAEADDVAGHLNFTKIEFEFTAIRIKLEDILVSSFVVGSASRAAPFYGPARDAEKGAPR